jgi:hypothetical protein
LALIRGLAADNHVHLPVTSDLFIEIDQESGNCYYYFADHGHRTVFWLHAVDTITVGLPDSCSKDHLRESRTSFAPSGRLRFADRTRSGGELLVPRRDVPRHRLPVFHDGFERAPKYSSACPYR